MQRLLLRRAVSTATARPAAASSAARSRRAMGTVLAGGMALSTAALAYNIATTAPLQLPEDALFANVDPRAPFKDKSTGEVFTSYLVFKLCTLPGLVELGPKLIEMAKMMGLESITNVMVKKTFFEHFCGGENVEELVPTMAKLKAAGIGSILDMSIEADAPSSLVSTDKEQDKNMQMEMDIQNRKADVTAAMMKQCIETAGGESGSYVAVKVTALGPAAVLMRVSLALAQFTAKLHIYGKTDLSQSDLASILVSLPDNGHNIAEEHVKALFRAADKDNDGTGTPAEILTALENSNIALLHLIGVSLLDVDVFRQTVARVNSLCELAQKKKVKLMIDAEQTYFQPAIDYVAIEMSRRFNNYTQKPTVCNTYQLYLQDGLQRLTRDVDRAKAEKWGFGAKLVRGAYMQSEHQRAKQFGYPSPINATIDDTHHAYNTGVLLLLSKLATGQPVTFMVASHNRQTIVTTIKQMEELHIDPHGGHVEFGQLMGMHEFTSYALANTGFPIYKYIPYGPIHEVIPYLIRRAQENSAILGGAQLDRTILWHELIQRLVRDPLGLPFRIEGRPIQYHTSTITGPIAIPS